MAHYFSRKPRPINEGWEADDDTWPCDVAGHILEVSDHEPIDTGLLDADGNCIMRAPNPIGFGKDEEW